MTAQANQQNATVLLRDEHDYRAWYSQLQARCVTYNIWEQVNPDGTKLPLMEPFPPELPECADYAPSTGLPAGANPTRLSDLSSAGQRAYKDDLEIYKLKMEQYKTKYARYKTEITNLQHIMILVHLPSRFTYSAPAVRQMDRSETGSRTFEPIALKPPRSANNWDTWLAEYNQAVTEAETLKVPDTTQFRSVAVDFMSAVNKIAPIWAATFQSNGMDQPGVTQKDMMRRFREYMMLNHPITRNRSQKAAFAVDDPSVFLAANSNADQRVDGDTHHVETGNSRQKTGRPRYQRTAIEEGDREPPSSSILQEEEAKAQDRTPTVTPPKRTPCLVKL
ncbi:hypothetical protein A1F94_012313 [Pyrenophora tritici-repentis]|nr:hypothetical protein A1F94_012313 [Pyrenophora tritici-repentis]